ncbi:MAG: 4Fe-4S dicluster domain-containing protein [bacterium]|nr:4Fe-4S dicluster domain-containing protein [bacterium]
MPSIDRKKAGQQYWRSLNELADTPEFHEFMRREFPEGASQLLGENRRSFLKVMAASFALAGLTSCRWPKEKIVPYAHRPDNRMPGVPVFFATSMEKAGVATGLLVKSYDGRPIKVEGNPDHPDSLGAAGTQAQAAILEMYDPDRGQAIIHRENGQEITKSWEQFVESGKELFAGLRTGNGSGLFFLHESTASPTFQRLKKKIQQSYPQAKWAEYEPINDDNERSGAKIAFGVPYRPQPEFSQAKVIVSLDCDFLGSHPASLSWARKWAEKRDPDGEMNRLYVIESLFSATGAMADHRLALKPSQIEAFARSLAEAVVEMHGLPDQLSSLKGVLSNEGADEPDAEVVEFVRAMAKDLVDNAGAGVVFAGSRQPETVHVIAHVLNSALGNIGKSIQYIPGADPMRPTQREQIEELAESLEREEIDTLVILGGNPAYDAPAGLEFTENLPGVKHTIHLSLYQNETSQLCEWYIPRAHFLEAWGDARSYDGTISSIQPLIAPLYDGKSPVELLALIAGDEPESGHDIVRKTFDEHQYGRVEQDWRRFLHNGVLAGSAEPLYAPAINVDAVVKTLAQPSSQAETLNGAQYELVLFEDSKLFDGRFANNGWLQETPDFLSKLTWDNALLISPRDMETLGVKTEDVVTITAGSRTLDVPVYVMPGVAPGSVAIALGYGRTHAGRVAEDAGVNTYEIRTAAAMHHAGVSLKPAGRRYKLASTQDHFAIDKIGFKERNERIDEIIYESTHETYKNKPEFAKERGEHFPKVDLWQPHEYNEKKWGMTIDLNKCVGCNACVTACQSENNIPVVGKEQVTWGREMHWIRVDRYFKGDPDKPSVTPQPMTCIHCENAPCEQVCPVQATVHSNEGVNVMVYNRCVGTRYCLNNCPLKVRRFNFFNFNYGLKEVEKLHFNPEVTVRMRGVMEKCSFCMQRIEAVKIAAKNERRAIADGEIVTACQQTCPTQAITFGDLNDENSQVSKKRSDARSYTLLEVLNLKPHVSYLAKIRNPNPLLASASEEQSEDHGHGALHS